MLNVGSGLPTAPGHVAPALEFRYYEVARASRPLVAWASCPRRHGFQPCQAGVGPAARVSTFGFTAAPELITALSEGRGYGEAGGGGLLSSCKISESLTHPDSGSPLSRKRARAVVN
jgi:hypothetical protein